MISLLVFVAAYAAGGIPTADWLAARRQLDLRSAGSGNPGANNALRLGGRTLAAQILVVELGKGVGCVAIGGWLAGDPGMLWSGLGAITGNVANPYRRFRGGQGLAITAGVLLAAQPIAALCGLAVIAVAVRLLHSTAPAALLALVAVAVTSAVGPAAAWGIATRSSAVGLALGVAAIVAPKQLARLRSASRPPTPAPG